MIALMVLCYAIAATLIIICVFFIVFMLGIMFKNNKGKHDLKHHEIMILADDYSVENDLKTVYICSPYRGDVLKNTESARTYCRDTILNTGLFPIAPHIYTTQFLNDEVESERSIGIEWNMKLIDKCDYFYVFGDTISEGMKAEIEYAKSIGKVITYEN